ncbi:MAG TPA: ATP-binding protein [Pyrinomonadaceae bacterium]|nr:ATP-binding protein [Pyrinomonadaceae bacterium]
MSVATLTRDAILRVGEVSGVDGRRIYILVDKNKNLSDMFLDGDILRNTSVNSYVEIRKGFLSIIGRVEGEKIEEEFYRAPETNRDFINRNKRILTVSLAGYIDETGSFTGGAKELPLIGNEAYIVSQEKIHVIHNLVHDDSPYINIATSYGEGFDIQLPIDGLFNSHIAIFGNTGSGKSNTLAYLYQELFKTLRERNLHAFTENSRFVLFDFNGEYTSNSCISTDKTVYALSTRSEDADKLPLSEDGLLDVEILSVLSQATEKTQKPFLGRALKFLNHVRQADDPDTYLKNILHNRVKDTLRMSDKVRAFLLLDYFREILPQTEDNNGNPVDISADLDWHNTSSEFKLRGQPGVFLAQQPDRIDDTILYQHINNFEIANTPLSNLICFLYLQLISDVLSNRAQNEHVVHVINRLKSKRGDIDKLFNLQDDAEFWATNFVVVNLDDVNLDMKKTIPLLLAKKLYADHKKAGPNKTLNIIVDEAHNILSTQSFRETDSWKDYRLETFEEIVKEGRKFGAFVTISSQRPNDISPTLTSQAHNYFIHRLINQRDLDTIASAVSYIDRLTEESIPTLPTGTCIFSGVASQMPLKINIKPLDEDCRPRSSTRKFSVIVPEPEDLPLD